MNREFLRRAQDMQRQLTKAQEALANETIEASVGGGAVTIVMDGQQHVRSVHIAPEAVDPESLDMLEDLVSAAITQALDKARELAAKRLGGLAGGLGLPGLP
ncbi:MAG TPA: YbaB/EbfC family nucleoid-associated protein [Dehalococcoidia bacterium]|nr:YbaB/EbfC family nucleoid-associated protein [Dehalococcoidia bacterium]